MTTYFNPPSVIGLINGEPTGMAVDFMLDKLYDRRSGVQTYYGTPWAAAGGPVQFSRAGNATVVDKDGTHRGIAYSIYRLSEQRWTWHVEPPACIKGLRHEKGEVSGEQTDAAAAARNAIEIQIRQFTQ